MCRVFARYDAGDRLFFWADIVGCSGAPTKWLGEQPAGERSSANHNALRENEFFAKLTDVQRQQLKADRDRDAANGRPLHDVWRLKKTW